MQKNNTWRSYQLRSAFRRHIIRGHGVIQLYPFVTFRLCSCLPALRYTTRYDRSGRTNDILCSRPRAPIRQGILLVVYNFLTSLKSRRGRVKGEVHALTEESKKRIQSFRITDVCFFSMSSRAGLCSAILSIRTGFSFRCSRTISKMKLLGASVLIDPAPA